MAIFCIPKKKIVEFRKALKNKELDILKLMRMPDSEARIGVLKKFFGDDAKDVNLLFEQKLILKNWVQGVKNWASKTGEIGRYDPLKKVEMAKLLEQWKEQQRGRMFNPKENESFLANLVEEKLGTRISEVEAKSLFTLQSKANTLKSKIDINLSRFDRTSEQQKIASEYGSAQVVANKYLESLKGQGRGLKEELKNYSHQVRQDWKEGKVDTVKSVLGTAIKTINDNSISMVASFDNSFIGRQGLHTLQTHPVIWRSEERRVGKECRSRWSPYH